MPGPACSVCTSQHVAAINSALVQGDRVSIVAKRFGMTDDSVRRHFNGRHWPKPSSDVAAAAKAAEVEQGNELFKMAHRLRDKAIQLALSAENRGDLKTAISGVTSATRTLALMAEMQGEIDRGTTVNIAVGAPDESLGVAIAILGALRDEPVARQKVLAALAKFSLVPPTVEHEAEAAGQERIRPPE